MALSLTKWHYLFTLFGGLKNTHFFWRPSWIYANCKKCQKLTACHSSQIGSMTPVKDRETKKVQVGKDQEKVRSETDSNSKNRGGKKTNQQLGTDTKKT